MGSVLLSSNVAKAIGRILHSEVRGVSVEDLLHRALGDILLTASDEKESPSDAEIRGAISAELDARDKSGQQLINVSVRDGVVEFRGVISGEHERGTLHAIAEAAPGVKAVHDHLIWIDRVTGAYLLSPEDSQVG
jgi:osmotically-inducible protein OsmY